MSIELIRGQNTPLTDEHYSLKIIAPTDADDIVDVSAFMLNDTGKVTADSDFVFYNQPLHPSGALGLASTSRFTITLDKMPADITSVAFVFTINHEDGMAILSDDYGFQLEGSTQHISFAGSAEGRREQSLIVMSLYRRNGQWKVKPADQGFLGGIAPLATQMGLDVGYREPISDAEGAPVSTAAASTAAASTAADLATPDLAAPASRPSEAEKQATTDTGSSSLEHAPATPPTGTLSDKESKSRERIVVPPLVIPPFVMPER